MNKESHFSLKNEVCGAQKQTHCRLGKRPAFLSDFHYPLIQEEIEFMAQFHGRKRREYDEALELNDNSKRLKDSHYSKIIREVICSFAFKGKRNAELRAKQGLRLELFLAAQKKFQSGISLEASKTYALQLHCAATHCLPEKFSLFDDLPNERKIDATLIENCHHKVIEIANSRLIKRLLRNCTEVKFSFDSNVKNIVRLSKLKGLVLSMNKVQKVPHTSIECFRNEVVVSGPLSLFQQTPIYTSALFSLFSQVCYSSRFLAQIMVVEKEIDTVYSVYSGDPIKPGKIPLSFDSRLEKRFVREFTSRFPYWQVIREPQAFELEVEIIFPDFMLKNTQSGQEFLLEIVGYWTQDYFVKKIEQYKRLQARSIQQKIVLCVDRKFESLMASNVEDCGLIILYFDKFICLEKLEHVLKEHIDYSC